MAPGPPAAQQGQARCRRSAPGQANNFYIAHLRPSWIQDGTRCALGQGSGEGSRSGVRTPSSWRALKTEKWAQSRSSSPRPSLPAISIISIPGPK